MIHAQERRKESEYLSGLSVVVPPNPLMFGKCLSISMVITLITMLISFLLPPNDLWGDFSKKCFGLKPDEQTNIMENKIAKK